MIDLLNLSTFKKPLQVRWSRVAGGFYVENLFTVECEVCCTLPIFFSLFAGSNNGVTHTHNIHTMEIFLDDKPNFLMCDIFIQEFDDLLAVLEEGMKNRAVGSHG